MAAQDLLMPGGHALGQPGSRPDIREVPGSAQDAEDFFAELVQGGTPVFGSTHPRAFHLPCGGRVGFRAVSKNHGPPTIDANIPGVPITKVKFI